MGTLIQNTILKFSKTKNQTQKRPPKVPKNQKNICKEASNQIFDKKPPTNGNSDSKYNLDIFKNQKSNSKKSP